MPFHVVCLICQKHGVENAGANLFTGPAQQLIIQCKTCGVTWAAEATPKTDDEKAKMQ